MLGVWVVFLNPKHYTPREQVVEALEVTRLQLLLAINSIFAFAADLLARFWTPLVVQLMRQ